jgi:hypothetical protein
MGANPHGLRRKLSLNDTASRLADQLKGQNDAMQKAQDQTD